MKKIPKKSRWLIMSLAVLLVAGSAFFLGKFQSEKTQTGLVLGERAEVLKEKGTGEISFRKIQLDSKDFGKFSELDGVAQIDRMTKKTGETGIYSKQSTNPNTLIKIETKKDLLGIQHSRFNQSYKNVPVFGSQLAIHVDPKTKSVVLNGRSINDIDLNVEPKIAKDQAVSQAKKYFSSEFPNEPVSSTKAKLYVFNLGLIQNRKDSQNQLVWKVDVFGRGKTHRKIYFISANSGELVYEMEGQKNAIDRRIYDMSWGKGVVGRFEGQSEYGETDLDNLYSILGSAYNYYSSEFSLDGANGLGGLGDDISDSVTNTTAYALAYRYNDPDGFCPNASFSPTSTTLTFCEGQVTYDVVGHEYSHAVNYYTIKDEDGYPSGLVYGSESGAVEEGYADIFGEALENYATGDSDWKFGESASDNDPRILSDPESIVTGNDFWPQPAKFSSENYYCGNDDIGGVHHNNSVLSHAAYLMAMGGNFNGYSITAIGKDAEEHIFQRAREYYLNISSGFNETYEALNTSCGDLYGSGSDTCLEAQKAMQAVEMNLGGKCASQPSYWLYDLGTKKYRDDRDHGTVFPFSNRVWAKYKLDLVIGRDILPLNSDKSKVRVKLNNRKVKVLNVKPHASDSLADLTLLLKYRKWGRGSYTLSVDYKDIHSKSWHKNAVSLKDAIVIY
jgi:Zn-dependent metalloprotease